METAVVDTKSYNSKLRALMSIRNFSKAEAKNHEQMKQIERNLRDQKYRASSLIEQYCSIDSQEKWKKINYSLFAINDVLNAVREKIKKKDRSDSTELWKNFDSELAKFKQLYESSEKLGLELLPESEREHWKNDICNVDVSVLPLIVSYAEASRTELEMIEKYTPKELDFITQIVIDHIPENFDFDDADKYENEYLNALEEFRKEFRKEKNLWDTFLDILAGGTHQPPSENVMLRRWIDGEKEDGL